MKRIYTHMGCTWCIIDDGRKLTWLAHARSTKDEVIARTLKGRMD